MTATDTGNAFGFRASGNPVGINGHHIMRVVEGKSTEIYHVEELREGRLLMVEADEIRAIDTGE